MRFGAKYGYCDIHGHQVVDAVFSHAYEYRDDVAIAISTDGSPVLLDNHGVTMIELEGYKIRAYEFSYGLLPLSENLEHASVGYIDKTGKFVIEPQFAQAFSFNRQGATVKIGREDRTERRIDRNGNLTGEPFLSIGHFHPDGLFTGAMVAWEDQGKVVINGKGEQVSGQRFDMVWQEHEGLIPVIYEEGSVGWVDIYGEPMRRMRGFAIGNHFESRCVPVADSDEKWGLFHVEGQWVLEPEFEFVESVGPNRYAIGHRKDDSTPVLQLHDAYGHVFGNERFNAIDRFSSGVAMVWRDSNTARYEGEMEYNFINFDGEILLPQWS